MSVISNVREYSPVFSGEEKSILLISLCAMENSPRFPWRREFSSPFSPRRNEHITSFSPSFLLPFVVDRENCYSGGKTEGERGRKPGETQEKAGDNAGEKRRTTLRLTWIEFLFSLSSPSSPSGYAQGEPMPVHTRAPPAGRVPPRWAPAGRRMPGRGWTAASSRSLRGPRRPRPRSYRQGQRGHRPGGRPRVARGGVGEQWAKFSG